MNLLGKAKYLASIPFVYRNFWQGVLSGSGLLDRNKDYVYRLWNGLRVHATGSKWDFFILNEIFVIGEYDVKLPKEPKTIVDVGANIGAASLFFANKYRKAKIFSIEPFKKNFERLKSNVEENKLSSRVKAFNIALGDKRKQALLYICEDNDGCHTLLKELNPKAETITVNVVPLEAFLDENRIEKVDLLKLDCEGAEIGILRSIKDFSRIDNIVLEASAGQTTEAKALLEKHGFLVSRVEGRPLLFATKA